MRCRTIGLAGAALLMAAMWGLAMSQAQEPEPRDQPVVDPLQPRGALGANDPWHEPARAMPGRGFDARLDHNLPLPMPAGGLEPARADDTPRAMPARMHLVPQSDEVNAIANAAARLRDLEGEARADAERHLHGLLQEYFDADLRQREAQLAQAEARLEKLRDLLERRREKKEEIIGLQIQVLENEAEGLGFFNPLPQGAPYSLPQGAPYPPLPQGAPYTNPPQPAYLTPTQPVYGPPQPW